MSLPRLPRPRREDLRLGECLCDHCTAKCCRYFALQIDAPKSREEYDYIRWYLLHERASIFVDDGTWHLLVHTPCRRLQANNLCGIYHSRPQICRDYTTDECEYDGDGQYDMLFECADQIAEFAEAFLPQVPRANATGGKRKLNLPILSVVAESA